ncbi:protoporphyrinogen oxidase [Nocardioides sp. BGMRC 2183]|nr:protoporphyrinogen oxidase [Nocardioides sp. BGMRC 2183]
MQQRVVVVGAGIAGLVAAHDLTRAGRSVLVLEATDVVGGKLRRAEVAGITVDVGAEAMVHRRPEGVELAGSLGLDLVHPTAATSRVWTRGALRPLPRTLMGAPLDLAQLAAGGILGADGLQRARQEPELPATDIGANDISVGDLVDVRYGAEVTDRLVEPLLGGVYAGHARAISVRAAVPQLLTLAEHGSITVQAGAAPPASATGPVFAGVPGGMWQLPAALRAALESGGSAAVRTGVRVTGLRRTEGGFEVTATDATGHAWREDAGAVVVATPAPAASRLLVDLAPEASAMLAQVEYASPVVVTFAFRAADPGVRAALDVGASGLLVPPVDRRRIKAATFSFAKWDWVRAAGAAGDEELLVLRTSLGRSGDAAALQVPDEELVAAAIADLELATGLRATPVDHRVQRWGGGLPQYAVGHLDLVAAIRREIERVPGLAVGGAAYDGVGIPACIGSGHRAAERVLAAR